MKNKIKISACGNELYLIAYQGGTNYQLAHLISANNHKIELLIYINPDNNNNSDVLFDLKEIAKPKIIKATHKAVNEKYNILIPKGEYTIIPICINWEGSWSYNIDINGQSYSNSGTDGVGEIGKLIQISID